MKYLYLAKKPGHPGRGRQPVPRARPRLATGCRRRSSRPCSARRSATCTCRCGRVATSPSPTPSCKRLIDRGAVDRGVHRRPHRGLGRARRLARGAGPSTTCWSRPASPPSSSRRSSTCTPGRGRRSSSGRWASPSTATPSTACAAIVNLGLARGNVGRDGAGLMPIRGHSGVQGGAEMGAYATAFPGGLAVDERARGALWPSAGASPCPTTPGLHRDRRWSRPPSRASSTCCGRRAATSSTCCPTRTACGRRWPASRCASTRTSCVTTQMLVDGRRRAPAAGGHPLRAGGRRHRDHHRAPHRLLAPRSPGRVGEARSEWRLFADVAARVQPGAGRRASPGPTTRRCGPRSPRSSRPTPASRPWPTPATRCSGAAATSAPSGVFPTPDGRGTSPRSCRTAPSLGPRRQFTVATRRGKQFNSMVHAEVDPLTGADRDDVLHRRGRRRRARRARRARVVRLRQRHRHLRRPLQLVRLPDPLAAGALARGQRADRRRRRAPRAALARSPTTTPSSPSRCSTSASG